MRKLSRVRCKILRCLSEYDIPMTPLQIHYKSGIPHNTVKQYLIGLFKDGFVHKPLDALYAVTASGRKMLENE